MEFPSFFLWDIAAVRYNKSRFVKETRKKSQTVIDFDRDFPQNIFLRISRKQKTAASESLRLILLFSSVLSDAAYLRTACSPFLQGFVWLKVCVYSSSEYIVSSCESERFSVLSDG